MRAARMLFVVLGLSACAAEAALERESVLTTLQVSLTPAIIDSGATATATAEGKDQFGQPMGTGTVAWSSTFPTIAAVTSAGIVSGLAPGQTTITATTGGVSGNHSLIVRSTTTVTTPASNCQLPARFSGVALGFPRVPGRLKATGDVHIPVVFVDFSDAVATRTPQAVFAILSPGAENYYSAVSYGRMHLVLQPTYTWYRMSQPSSQYGWSALTYALHKTYIEEALSLATTTDLSQADGFLVVSNPDAGSLTNGPAFTANAGTGVTVRGTTLANGATSGRDLLAWGSFWLNHEMGHTLSLVDLYAYSGSSHRFVGGYSMMGLISGFAREYFGWERWQLGWLDDSQVACATQPGTRDVSLTPIERVGGTKMIVVPTGATTAIVVESRRAEGYDNNSGWSPGVLVYSIDTSIPSGSGTLKVLPVNDTDTGKGNVTLKAGDTMTIGGITVTFVSGDSAHDLVRVTR